MNCADARANLAALAYDDLPPADAGKLRGHLAGCPACREEFDALTSVRRMLDAPPAPPVRPVDVAALLHQVAAEQRRRARRWKWTAAAAWAVAAGLLLVVVLRLEFRVRGNEFAVRWGPGQAPTAVAEQPVPRPTPDGTARIEERLRVLDELVHALAEDSEAKDARQQAEIVLVRARVEAIRRQSQDRLEETERDLSALYAVQFGSARKGE